MSSGRRRGHARLRNHDEPPTRPPPPDVSTSDIFIPTVNRPVHDCQTVPTRLVELQGQMKIFL